MRRILCSTGALIGRPNGRDHRLLEALAPKLSCDGFEFMIYDTWYPSLSQVVADVRSMGLCIPTVHCEKGIGELIALGKNDEAVRNFELNCEAAERLGAGLLVLHLWNGIVSDSNIELNYAAFPALDRIAKSHGLMLTVENVVCNHADPLTHLKRLAKSGASFTFDTKMAAFHGQLFSVFEPEMSDVLDNIRHLHINDYGGGYMDWKNLRTLHIGQGGVDFEEFFARLSSRLPSGYSGDFTVESTAFGADGMVDTELLNEDFGRVRAFCEMKAP